jgi:hypothetical protein
MEGKKRRRHGFFEAVFAFGLCLVLYSLVMLGSVWAPLLLGGEKLKPLVAFVLMPLDLVMLGWNQKWPVLLLHLGTTAAAFSLSRGSDPKQFRFMLCAVVTCALVTAVNDAINAYRHPPKIDAKPH